MHKIIRTQMKIDILISQRIIFSKYQNMSKENVNIMLIKNLSVSTIRLTPRILSFVNFTDSFVLNKHIISNKQNLLVLKKQYHVSS